MSGIQALLKVKRLSSGAKLPVRGTPNSAGLDIFADEDYIFIDPGETRKIATGIAIQIPPGFVGLFLDKGSIGSQGIHNFAGVIDSDYRGELFVFLHNTRDRPAYFVHGQKITQLVIVPYLTMEPYEVDDLTTTERGNGAFGSTGAF